VANAVQSSSEEEEEEDDELYLSNKNYGNLIQEFSKKINLN